jgi:hypothetical protein
MANPPGNPRNGDGNSEDLDEYTSPSLAGQPPDQQLYNNVIYGGTGQGQAQNQFQSNSQGSFPFTQQTYGTAPSPPTSNPYPYLGIANSSLEPRSIFLGQQRPTTGMAGGYDPSFTGQGYSFGPPPLSAPTYGGFGQPGPSRSGGNYTPPPPNDGSTNPFQQKTNRYPDPNTATTGYQDPGRANPNPPRVPVPAPCQPLQQQNRPPPAQYFLQPLDSLPLIGFPQTQNRQIEHGSSAGPLDPGVHGHLPIPFAHEELAYSNPPEWERQMLYYVDDGAQRVDESWDDYLRRASRAIVHMGIEVRRRPAPPPNQDRQAQRRWQVNIELQEADHRDWMDPSDEAYNPRYAMSFLAENDALGARNAQRRATAAALLRREFAAIGYRDFTHSLAPDESSDELFTHDYDSRPLFGDGGLSRGSSSQPSRGRAPQPRGGAGQPRGSTRETRGPNHPLQAGGLGGQGQAEDEEAEEKYEEYSEHRCLPCGKRKIGCSIRKTGLPCDNCKRTGRNCVRKPIGKRGVRSGDRRGGYNKSEAQRRKEEDKRREGGGRRGRKKVVDEEDQDDDEDEEDIPELNDEQPPLPPSPPPPSGPTRKRHREPTLDDDQQEESEPRPKKRREVANTGSGTRNTPNPCQQPREKPNNRSSGRRRIVQTRRVPQNDPYPDNWCSTCKKNLRSCDGNRPCQECLIHGEVDCDAEIFDQPYRSPRETMATPVRNEPNMTGYQTPVSGGPRHTYDAFAPSSSMVSQDMEMIDVDAPPLQDYLDSQKRIVPNATAEAVREEASEGWLGGRETADANAEDIEKLSEDVTLSGPDSFSNEVDIRSQSNANRNRNNSSDNAADPGRAPGPSQNPALPAYDGTTTAPAVLGPQARQQAQSSRAITNPVNPHIGIMRAPSNKAPDMSKRCDEPIPPPNGPKCKERPTQSCDWIGHAWYNVCKDCDGKARAGDFGLDEVVLAQTQNHLCSECAQETKLRFIQHPTSEIQARECLCIGQIRMAWLCGTHRNEASQYVEGRAKFFENSRKTRGLYGKCPVCDDREGDDSTGVWECGACRETVIAP